jgi:hypothetical protein
VPADVLPVLFGDYNDDGTVNTADYTVWRNASGPTGLTPFTGADGNGDGMVTRLDYDVWVQHFGEAVPAAGSGGGSLVAEATVQGEGVDDATAGGFTPPTITPPLTAPHQGEGENPAVALVVASEHRRLHTAKTLTPGSSPGGRGALASGGRGEPLLALEAALLAWSDAEWARVQLGKSVALHGAADGATVDECNHSFPAAVDAAFGELAAILVSALP